MRIPKYFLVEPYAPYFSDNHNIGYEIVRTINKYKIEARNRKEKFLKADENKMFNELLMEYENKKKEFLNIQKSSLKIENFQTILTLMALSKNESLDFCDDMGFDYQIELNKEDLLRLMMTENISNEQVELINNNFGLPERLEVYYFIHEQYY